MILKRLTILNYRNIATAELDFSPKINCFVGHNGEGKTNILDAIHFLSLTKSTASSIDSQNIRHGEEMMMVQGVYDLNGVEEEVSTLDDIVNWYAGSTVPVCVNLIIEPVPKLVKSSPVSPRRTKSPF